MKTYKKIDGKTKKPKGWLTAVLLDKDPKTGELLSIPVYVEHSLESLYKTLKCNYVEMPTRYINGKPYIFICDEEGLLDPEKKYIANAVSYDMTEMIVGLILIVRANGEHLYSLREEEAESIARNDSFYWRLQIGNRIKRIALRYHFRREDYERYTNASEER